VEALADVADKSELVDILNIEAIDLDMFRGRTPDGETRRIYGGQVVAQSLAAAYRTVEGRVCHSLHCYFIRGGDPKIPILLKVERVRDGGSFTMRRVTALQHGQQIFNLSASFQTPETGLEHQIEMPATPGPDGLLDEDELRKAGGETEQRRTWPIEVRPVDPPPAGRLPGPLARRRAHDAVELLLPAAADPRTCAGHDRTRRRPHHQRRHLGRPQ